MKDKKGILLMGAGVAERFQIGKISELAGMCVSSPYFPKTVGFVMATTLPPTSDLLGEFQLSIQKFAKKLKEVKSD